jgi:hypothetical protein
MGMEMELRGSGFGVRGPWNIYLRSVSEGGGRIEVELV